LLFAQHPRRDSTRDIGKIAWRVGYDSDAGFNRAFRLAGALAAGYGLPIWQTGAGLVALVHLSGARQRAGCALSPHRSFGAR
jgi:hypothetical protein